LSDEKIDENKLAVLKEVGKASSEAMLHAAGLVRPGGKGLRICISDKLISKFTGRPLYAING
jgi:hypothetical protein